MDKEYLIHNIDYKDNPEDQHQTLDITLSNLEIAGQDITADVGIDTFLNGMLTSSNKYEDVSLTGAGGGGGGGDFDLPNLYKVAVAQVDAIQEKVYINLTWANAIDYTKTYYFVFNESEVVGTLLKPNTPYMILLAVYEGGTYTARATILGNEADEEYLNGMIAEDEDENPDASIQFNL